MTDPETLSLAGDFAPATRDDWRKLVEAVLKGAPFQRLESKTYDGLSIAPLYERVAAAHAVAGRAPPAAWTIMQRVDHPDPAAANAQARDDLQNGATGLALVFAGSVNANDFGLDGTAAAVARALDGVRLDAGISLDIDLAPFAREVAATRRRHDQGADQSRRSEHPLRLRSRDRGRDQRQNSGAMEQNRRH